MGHFELAKEAPGVISNIESLFGGARISVPQGEIESVIFDVVPGRKRLLGLTLYALDGKPVGICDVIHVADTQISILESPISWRYRELKMPAADLRNEAEVDGLYVAEPQRGKHFGGLLLTTALELSKRYGSQWLDVRSPGKYKDWYKKLGAKEIINGVQFNLAKNTWR